MINNYTNVMIFLIFSIGAIAFCATIYRDLTGTMEIDDVKGMGIVSTGTMVLGIGLKLFLT